jgi:hypothetical protein
VTDMAPDHAPYDELAAGHALHALDPGDEQRFGEHLADCPRCQAAVGDYTEVAAALSENWSTMEPSPRLGHRIMAAIADEPRRPAQSPGPAAPSAGPGAEPPAAEPRGAEPRGIRREPAAVADLSAQRNRHRRPRPRSRPAAIAAAAAAVVVAGGAIWGGLAAAGGGSAARTPVAGCTAAQTCRQVLLTSATSHTTDARVIVKGDAAWLVPSGLPADDATRQVYVLWQINGARQPLAVGSFDVRGHQQAAVRIGTLSVSYRSTRAFAVSLEHGRNIPAVPTRTVALGQVKS